MARIGTPTLANTVTFVERSWSDTGNCPDGWEYVGGGSFRNVFLHKDSGVVYKVEQCEDSTGYDNVAESRTAKRLRRMKWENVRIPNTTLYRTLDGPILAMEYVKGVMGTNSVPTRHRAARKEILKAKLADMHGGNFIFQGRTLVPIDMASVTVRPGDWDYEVDDRPLRAGNGNIGW